MTALDEKTLDALADAIANRLSASAPLLDAEGAAELLNVPPSWVLAEARAGRVPNVQMGKYRRFRRSELIAWLDRKAAL